MESQKDNKFAEVVRRSSKEFNETNLKRATIRSSESFEETKESQQENTFSHAVLKQSEEVEAKWKKGINSLAEATRQANESHEDTIDRLEKNALAQSLRRINESDEEASLRREINALAQATRRASESPGEGTSRRSKNALAQAIKRANETEEEKMLRRQINAYAQANRRANETFEEACLRRKMNAFAQANRRANESPEEAHLRRKLNAARQRRRRRHFVEEGRHFDFRDVTIGNASQCIETPAVELEGAHDIVSVELKEEVDLSYEEGPVLPQDASDASQVTAEQLHCQGDGNGQPLDSTQENQLPFPMKASDNSA